MAAGAPSRGHADMGGRGNVIGHWVHADRHQRITESERTWYWFAVKEYSRHFMSEPEDESRREEWAPRRVV
eukprot:1161341-Pyramimonas_sp.AAC.1